MIPCNILESNDILQENDEFYSHHPVNPYWTIVEKKDIGKKASKYHLVRRKIEVSGNVSDVQKDEVGHKNILVGQKYRFKEFKNSKEDDLYTIKAIFNVENCFYIACDVEWRCSQTYQLLRHYSSNSYKYNIYSNGNFHGVDLYKLSFFETLIEQNKLILEE